MEPTEQQIEAFKAVWALADSQGDVGNRVRRALAAVLDGVPTSTTLVMADSAELADAIQCHYHRVTSYTKAQPWPMEITDADAELWAVIGLRAPSSVGVPGLAARQRRLRDALDAADDALDEDEMTTLVSAKWVDELMAAARGVLE